jgi:hypothetical protein
MAHGPHHRNRLKLLISACVLSGVLIVAAVAQRNHIPGDPFAPEQARARADDTARPVFGNPPEPPQPQQTAPAPVAQADAPAATVGTVEQAAGREVPADVLGFLERWRSTLARKDLDQHVATYAPRVDKFFRKRRVSRDQVRREKAQMIAKYPDFNKYDLKDVRLESRRGNRAVVTFRKDWDTSGSSRFAGSERQRLTLRRTGESWQITGEEELKVYWVRRG